MAGSVSGDKEAQSPDDPSRSKRGGSITLPFMMATILGLAVTSFGWIMNLIVFLITEFNIKSIAAAQISNIVNGCLSMLPVVAAILADSFFGDIPVISVSAFISLLGILLLTLVAFFDKLRPRPCETGSILCQSPSSLQLGILYAALALVTTGTAGSRVSLASAGANQYDKPKDKGSFFNWYFLMINLGATISATAIVYTQDNASWKLGFSLCVAANAISLVVFLSGKRFYKQDKPLGSPFTSLIRVVVASIVKRNAAISSKEEDYHHQAKTCAAMPSKSFRFLNRAALKTEGDLDPNGASVKNIWRVCSVQEVEVFKAVLRLVPLWLAVIFSSTSVAIQASLMVLQALAMDRGLGPHFKVSAGSLQVISIITAGIMIIINNLAIFPAYQKVFHKPLTPLQKVGLGTVLLILSMAVSALVEAKRLKTVDMSVLWLFPPLVIAGIGEAFQMPANIELFYVEFPESLKNTATSMTSVVVGISFYVSTALIDVIQRTTEWLPNDINHGRVDNVYWVLVIIVTLNFGYFLVCSWFYRYRNFKDDDQEQDLKDVSS